MQGIDFNDNRDAGHCLQKKCSGEGGKKQEKTSPNRNDIMSFWLMETNARAAFWDMFNSMGGPLGVFSSEL